MANPKLETRILLQVPKPYLQFVQTDDPKWEGESEECTLRIQIIPHFFNNGPQEVNCELELRVKQQHALIFDHEEYVIHKNFGVITGPVEDTFTFKLLSKIPLADLQLDVPTRTPTVKIEASDTNTSRPPWYNSAIWELKL